MKLDWMMLANHAEVANGLLYIAGGTWDTTTIGAPLPPDGPPDAAGVVQGTLVARLLFHSTETGRDHSFAITVVDEDGGSIANVEGGIHVPRNPNMPPTWDHGVNLVIPLTGMPLPRFGHYNISLQLDGQHMGDRPFRLVKGY